MRRGVAVLGVLAALVSTTVLSGCGAPTASTLKYGEVTVAQWGACGSAFVYVHVPALRRRVTTKTPLERDILAIRRSAAFLRFDHDLSVAAATASTGAPAHTARAWKRAAADCLELVRETGRDALALETPLAAK